jgi:3',5'-cyclic AMP phosphodiesterase CpdA
LTTAAAGSLLAPKTLFGDDSSSPLRFAVIGDFGTGDDDEYGLARQMCDTYKSSPFRFVVTAGDNIYPNGSARHFKKKFEEPFAELLREKVSFYAVLGNHDVEEGRRDQIHYPLFNMDGRSYYVLSKGDQLVNFFMLDTTAFDLTQATWLENALRASRSKWRIAVFHQPIYSSGKKHGSDLKLRSRLEPILLRYGVHVVFSGHDHIYERTLPQKGIQYFVTGAGGKMRRGGVDLKSPIRAASYDQDNHFMLIEVDEEEIAFKAISEAGQVVDQGIIRQAE